MQPASRPHEQERTRSMIDVQTVQGDIAQQTTDCLVVNLFEGVTAPGGATGAVDSALGGAISDLIRTGDFTGAAGTTALLYTGGRLPAARVLIVGLGAANGFDSQGVRRGRGGRRQGDRRPERRQVIQQHRARRRSRRPGPSRGSPSNRGRDAAGPVSAAAISPRGERGGCPQLHSGGVRRPRRSPQ